MCEDREESGSGPEGNRISTDDIGLLRLAAAILLTQALVASEKLLGLSPREGNKVSRRLPAAFLPALVLAPLHCSAES